MTGDLLKTFFVEVSAWAKIIKRVSELKSPKDFKKETDDRMQSIKSILDRTSKARVPSALSAINVQATTYLSESLYSLTLQQEWYLKHGNQLEAAVRRQATVAAKHLEKLNDLVRAYHATIQEAACPHCHTWVKVDTAGCHHCKRDFKMAERLGLVYLYSHSIRVFSEKGKVLSLEVIPSVDPDGDTVRLSASVILFIDYALASLTPSTRETTVAAMGRLLTDVKRMWDKKQFTWSNLPKQPSNSSTAIAELKLHFVAKEADKSKIDLLYEISPSSFMIESVASDLLPTLVKWSLAYTDLADRTVLAVFFLYAYEERWLPGIGEKQADPEWLNRLLGQFQN
jgi:hypothetical protein